MITNLKIFDNFYNDPDLITKMVTDFVVSGCGTGLKTVDLQNTNARLANDIKFSLCQMHGVDPNHVMMNSFFMQHEYNQVDDYFNRTSIHISGKNAEICRVREDYDRMAFSGQIFLTKDPDPDASIFTHAFKSDVNWSEQEILTKCIDEYTNPGEWYKEGKISLEEYKRLRDEYECNFYTTCEIKNVYNRMVSWKAGTLHSQIVTKKVPNLLYQYFFFDWI